MVLRIFCIAMTLHAFASVVRAQRLVPFEDNGKFGYRDDRGLVVITPQFEVAQDFLPAGIAPVVDSKGWAYIDRTGKVVIRPFVYDNGPDPFQEGLARFRSGNRFGFFNETGRIVIQPQFDFVLPFSEGVAAMCTGCKERREEEHTIMEGGKWGFIDKKGVVVIPAVYDEAKSFEDRRAHVKLNGQWLYIDRSGKRTGD